MYFQLVVGSHSLKNSTFPFLVSPSNHISCSMQQSLACVYVTCITKQTFPSCLFSPTGRIPLDPRLTQSVEEGKSFVHTYRGTPTETAVAGIVQKLLSETDGTNTENDDSVVRTT